MRRTIVLTILDGWGIGRQDSSNPIFVANPPNINYFRKNFRSGSLQASGIAVGLPWGEEGNSEVGHLTIGAGKVLYQHYPRISMAIRDKTFFKNEILKTAFNYAKQHDTAVNCMGLLTAGNVHASFEHVEALIRYAKISGVTKLNIHPIIDGKDSGRRSAEMLIKKLEGVLAEVGIGAIGSIGGRYYGLDRDGHTDRTKKFFDAAVGVSSNATDDIEGWLKKNYERGLEDEFIEPITLSKERVVAKDDALIFWDFREDSIRQITGMFIESGLAAVTTFTKYAPAFNVPIAFPEENVKNPLGAVLAANDKVQLRIAETEKYAHVTYFFNGLRNELFKNEYRVLIPSQNVAHHDEHPEMRAEEISARIVQAVEEQGTDLIVANFANSDMIAHTGNFDAAVQAINIIDTNLRRIFDACIATNSILMITSDHGNVEQMRDPQTGVTETRHNPSPVPLYLIGKNFVHIKSEAEIEQNERETTGVLSDVAPTILDLLQLPIPQEMTGTSLLKNLR